MKLFVGMIIIGSLLFSGCKNGHKNVGQDSYVYKVIDSSKISDVRHEPYKILNGGKFESCLNDYSPDPIFNYIWNNPKLDDSLQIYFLRPINVVTNHKDSFKNIESLLTDDAKAVVRGRGSLMFDFGIENAAWLEFESPDFNGEVTMSISEYNEPAIVNLGAQHHIKTLKPIQYGNIYRLELNDQLYEGVRFGWINVETFDKSWTITNVRLVCQIKPVNYTGSFYSDNKILNKIWYTGAYGVKLNLLHDYLGAILMERSDRHSWTGDAHTSQAAALVAFSNYEFVKKNIENTSTDDNNIPAYSLYWILSLIDYYTYTGDSNLLLKYIDNIEKKITLGLEVYDERLPLVFMGSDERIGAVFEYPDCDESFYTYKMLFLQTCNELAKVMDFTGNFKLSERYRNIYEEKIEELHKNSLWWKDYGIHSLANAVNAQFISKNEKEDFYKKEFSDPLHVIDYSPFNMYFTINALARMNRYDEALDAIERFWGGQIELGATTFWEVYRPDWNDTLSSNDAVPNCQTGYTSLCHPWGGGVTKWLTEEIVGIKPVTPGFTTFTIIPHFGRSLKKVQGKVNTINGKIRVEFDLNEGLMNFEIPDNCQANVGVPKLERKILKITLNNNVIYDKSTKEEFLSESISEDDDYVYVNSVKKGKYKIVINYEGETPKFQKRQINYDAEFVGFDLKSGTNWNAQYGKEGSVFFNFLGSGKHLINLPEFVDSVYIRYPPENNKVKGKQVSNIFYTVDVAKNIYITENVGSDEQMSVEYAGNIVSGLGALSTDNPNVCQQTFHIDIHANSLARSFQVALFFKDWNRGGKRQAIEMFDLETKKMIAPTKFIKDFENGIYVIYRYNKSIRFRINHVRGDNAILNAVFYD